jgi:maltose alpha-D-glucosyltransferase/alpha-amylase
VPVEDMTVMVLFDGWNSFFRSRVVPWRIALAERTRSQLERDLLPRFLQRQRWYAPKSAALQRTTVVHSAVLPSGGQEWLMALVDAQSAAGTARYFVPLAMAFDDDDEERVRGLAALAVSKVRQQAKMGLLADAMADAPFCRALVAAIGAGLTLEADGGTLRCSPGTTYASVVGDTLHGPVPLHRVTLSNNSVSLLGDRLFLKAYRRLQQGERPELEMGRYLTDVVAYANCVPVAGRVDFNDADGAIWTLALLQEQVTNQGDAWAYTLGQLARLLEAPARTVSDVAIAEPPVERFQALAQRVAELHLALARRTGRSAFEPEPMQARDLHAWTQAVRTDCTRTLALLETRSVTWAAPLNGLAARVLKARPDVLAIIDRVARTAPLGLKTRLHGNLRLEQVLIRRDDFVIIDFGGEPHHTFEEQRTKHSALRDVASMLRSFDYARHTGLHQFAQSADELERLAPVARRWERRVRAAFVATYREVAVAGGLYAAPAGWETAAALLDLFALEKSLYELRHEIDHRPDWVSVPLAAVAALAGLSD